MAVELRTKTGQTVLVQEHRVEAWEARGYERVTPSEPKAPAKKAAAKKSEK